MAAIIEKLPLREAGEVGLTAIIKETIQEIGDDDVPGLAAEMAYHSLLSLFPFLLFLAGLTAVMNTFYDVGSLTDRIVDRASDVLPSDATSLLRVFTDGIVKSRGGGAVVFGMLGALWAASAVIGTVMKALNRAYDVKEDRGFVKRKLTALSLTVLCGGLILAASILIGTGQFMAGALDGRSAGTRNS